MSETYTISADGKSITCKRCTMTSWHPMDVSQRYCGQCRMFHVPHIGEDALSADSLLNEVARLQADNAALKEMLTLRQTCENCGGKGSYWTDVGGEAEHEVCDCYIAVDELLSQDRPGAALLAELNAARAVVAAARTTHNGASAETRQRGMQALGTALDAYDDAVKARSE